MRTAPNWCQEYACQATAPRAVWPLYVRIGAVWFRGGGPRARSHAAQRSDTRTMSVKIDHLLNETRKFAPSPEFAASSVAKPELYTDAASDRLGFWADQARDLLHWHTPFT